MPRPLVSICLPNLNTRPFLPQRMEAILSQTNADWELVIFDNFSDDGSWEYFQTFREDPRVKLHQAPRAGIYPNWNNCLRAACGQYIHIATSDDIEKPEFQATLLNLLESKPDCALAYSSFEQIDQNDTVTSDGPGELRCFLYDNPPGAVRRPAATELAHTLALWAPWFTLNAVMFRRELLTQTGLFPIHMGSDGDTAWGWCAALAGDTLHSPQVLAQWRRHSAQATSPDKTPAQVALSHRKCVAQAQAFFADPAVRKNLPDHWTTRPGVLEELIRFRLKIIREYSALTRNSLRHSPRQFLDDCRWFLQHDRDYLFSQLRSGFGYPREIFQDRLPAPEFFADLKASLNLPDQLPLTEQAGREP